MNLKQAIKNKLLAKGIRVVGQSTAVVSIPLLLEIIELIEKDSNTKIISLRKEIEELKRTVKGFEILFTKRPEDFTMEYINELLGIDEEDLDSK